MNAPSLPSVVLSTASFHAGRRMALSHSSTMEVAIPSHVRTSDRQ